MLPIPIDHEAAFWHGQFMDHIRWTREALCQPTAKSMNQALGRLGEKMGLARSSSDVASMAQSLIAIHQATLGGYGAPAWPGWLCPSALRAMLYRQAWYCGRMLDRWTPAELFYFTAKTRRISATLLCHWLDPEETGLIAECRKHGDRLEIVMAQPSLYSADGAERVATSTAAFDHFVQSREIAQAEKIVPIGWFDHVYREGVHLRTCMRQAVAKDW